MKKLLIVLLISSILTIGCSMQKISSNSVSDMLESILYVDNKLVNTFMDGYELYLPHGINVVDKKDYNLTIKDSKNLYYLYVDTIAYYYNQENTFKEKNDHFYSKKFVYQDKDGFVDIVENNDYYFVVLMYNYAKIETYVLKENFDISFINMCSILSSVKYNDKVIKENIGTDGVNFKEEKFNIFDSKAENDNFLKYEEEYGTYKEKIIVPSRDNDIIDVDEVVE